ncbi:hypothetical protein LTR37_000583 [Vermiconidia calcicola]|uniref:Uncharacterized protein n=1 Tax=Vermiconidia calcicola TaxID=1690605 RepID=A0ACC3NY23_9PEZI|nr:hypothetical protein LTR37_000583 [Vermiconidia calcicola]
MAILEKKLMATLGKKFEATLESKFERLVKQLEPANIVGMQIRERFLAEVSANRRNTTSSGRARDIGNEAAHEANVDADRMTIRRATSGGRYHDEFQFLYGISTGEYDNGDFDALTAILNIRCNTKIKQLKGLPPTQTTDATELLNNCDRLLTGIKKNSLGPAEVRRKTASIESAYSSMNRLRHSASWPRS